ncbi:MAG: hypothetical protein U9R19_06925 [Bacteroidota bacterium]|nr:hypothetical protein [Bacteroidota bacterium]
MKIVNPLFDKAFKYLMENQKLAKKVISVLLDTEVEELSIGQQETTLPIEKRGLTLFRLDFKAIIKEADGSSKKVLIELQKSKFPTDIQRFRNYLGANYISGKTKKIDDNEESALYPIITIYILGYKMDDLPYLAVKVNRTVIDSSNNKPVNVKSFFIEHLTHQSHIIQVRRLPEKRRTRLEKFLTLFNQAWISEENYILDLQDVPDEFKEIAKYLQRPVMDDGFRRQLETEEEIDTLFDEQEVKFLKKIEEIQLQKEEERKQKEEAIVREKEANQREKEITIKFAKRLKKIGLSMNEISSETGLTINELKEVL